MPTAAGSVRGAGAAPGSAGLTCDGGDGLLAERPATESFDAEAAVRLESFVTPPMRNEVIEVGGVTIVNDAYNANPMSMRAAIDAIGLFTALATKGTVREARGFTSIR